MTYQIFQLPKQALVSGAEIKPGWKVSFFLTGSTTPTPVYTTSALSVAHTQPVTADSGGVLSAVYLDPAVTYKASVYDQNDVLQYTVDPVNESILSQAVIGGLLYPRTAAEITAGVTPTAYYYAPGDVRRYGATFDGSTDDTTALQNWLSVGGDLTCPVSATAKITSALTMVSNTTIRAVAGATIRQYTANTNVISATSKSGIRIYGLGLYAVGSMSSYFNGQGLHVESCTDVIVESIKVTNHRGWGVQFYNCSDCHISKSWFASSPVSNSDNHTQCAGDISLTGGTYDCTVYANRCWSGNGIAISVHSLTSTDNSDRNIVALNSVKNAKIYGIELYNNDPAGTVSGAIVSNNEIDTVTGAVAHSTDGYVYGAGIYAVAAINGVITGNRIRNTHSGGVVFVDQLAPGGIGLTQCGKMTVTDNEIDTCGMYGITVRDPGGASPSKQKTIIANNNISNVTQIGVQVKEKANVSIVDNEIDGVTSHGVHVSNSSTKRAGIKVCRNTIKGVGGTAVLVDYVTRSAFDANIIESPAVHGISIDNADTFTCRENKIYAHATYGIIFNSACSNYVHGGNVVNGNATAAYGIYYDAKGNLDTTDFATGCATANYFGNYNPKPSATPATGTWVQGDRVFYAGPSSGGNIGAVCTTGGTPGTWKTFGAIAA
jgi:hypothetical protein